MVRKKLIAKNQATLSKNVFVMRIYRKEKNISFPVRMANFKKPFQMYLYRDDSGQPTVMLKTVDMKNCEPIYVMDLPWVLSGLLKKLEAKREEMAE